MPQEEVSPVAEWYSGRSIFITGASGFMGKVLLEKLLYSCDKVKTIYILLRAKRGRTPVQRIQDMWKLPMFERLRKKDPDAIKKVVPLVGDLFTEGLGFSDEDLNLLTNNVSVVFHCAATLKLEANLYDAVEQNTCGTARVLDVCRKIKNLKAFVHYSTAFCSVDIDVFEEKVYDCQDDPRKVMEITKFLNPAALEKATPALIHPHPNTYTYTKRLAEKLVADENKNMPVCIIRPTIVSPAAEEPLPGWVDSLNGPIGVIVGAGKGVIRSMYCKSQYNAQTVPVDIAIAATIVIAQKLGSSTKRHTEVPVYNMSQHGYVQMTWRTLLDTGRKISYEYPFDGQLWYPDGDIRDWRIVHLFFVVLYQWIPALFIDFIMLILGQKRFMIRIQKRIWIGMELLQFFTTRQWHFKCDNFYALRDQITEVDNKVFNMDFMRMSAEEFFKRCILGAKQYCMKESLSSLPRCRMQQRIMYVLHKVAVFSFYYWMFSLLVHSNSVTEDAYYAVGKQVEHIPVLNYFIPSK